MWAILSGIEGNLAAYEAVLADIKAQRSPVEDIYILGDTIAPTPKSNRVVERIRSPRTGEPQPQVCQGWWEEQLSILHGFGVTGEPTEAIARYGMETVKTLWDAIDRQTLEWVRSLDFGFFEFDCLLVHGSSVSASEELTPNTPPIQILDRLMRMDANYLFCGRSGLMFQYEIQQGSLTSSLATLEGSGSSQTTAIKSRQAIGVGTVGRIPGTATYTLYNPYTNRLEFRKVRYASHQGFQPIQRF